MDLHDRGASEQTRITGWRAAALLGPALFLPCLNMLHGQTGIFEPIALFTDSRLATLTAVSNLIYLSWHAAGIVLILWAVREALAFPRHVSMATWGDILRSVVQFLGDILLVPLFVFFPAEKPVLGYLPTQQNRQLVAACPSLHAFKQTSWFRNQWLSFAAVMWDDYRGARFAKFVRRECITAPDGGVLALDWWEEPVEVPATKVLIIGATFTGDGTVGAMRAACQYFSHRGWRCVAMVKRGTGRIIPNRQPESSSGKSKAQPWCLSGFEDVEMAIDHVAAAYPDLPLCGLGYSLGAAQLRNYITRTGKRSKLEAVVLADAGEDWEVCLYDIDKRVPLLGRALNLAASQTLLRECHCVPHPRGKAEELADAEEPPTLRGGMVEVVRDLMGPAHGFKPTQQGARQYMRKCQPADPAGVSIPSLELFSFNDTLIDVPMVRDLLQLYRASPHIITCGTRGGSHIVRWEGLYAQCWIARVGYDFLEATLALKHSVREDDRVKGS
mmetsp:Transcript_126925/g.237307  ORF Transcript_126925/g.237307 Transcript_126925/m.237307 type:complete len:500 (-) Transcript_126925:65-1564(-)